MRYHIKFDHEISDLKSFALEVIKLLQSVRMSLYVIAPSQVRESFHESINAGLVRIKRDLPQLIEIEHSASNAPRQYPLAGKGLSGPQLQMKLGMFNRALSIVDRLGGTSRLKDVLEIANSILGSIADCLGIFAPITELIDMILKLLEISEEKHKLA